MLGYLPLFVVYQLPPFGALCQGVLILNFIIQPVSYSDGIPERLFSKKSILKKKTDKQQNIIKNFPGCKELTHQQPINNLHCWLINIFIKSPSP